MKALSIVSLSLLLGGSAWAQEQQYYPDESQAQPVNPQAPMPTDTPHRLRSWATFGFPHEIVVSPAVEWRTGFPYSIYDLYRQLSGQASGRAREPGHS